MTVPAKEFESAEGDEQKSKFQKRFICREYAIGGPDKYGDHMLYTREENW